MNTTAVSVLFDTLYMLLGVAALLCGRFAPGWFLLPNKNSTLTVKDEQKYIKSARRLIYMLGLPYLCFGLISLCLLLWPGINLLKTRASIFVLIVTAAIGVCGVRILYHQHTTVKKASQGENS